MTPHVDLVDTGVSLGGRPVLRHLALQVSPGEIVGVAGPNGSGKTTLLRLLATLVAPDEGEGVVLGARLGTSDVYAVRRRIGLLSHVPAVIGELTIAENLEHVTRLAGEDPGRITAALRVVGLDGAADRRGEDCSFGMLRRTEAARILITRPHLLLLDEAYSGLDADARDLIDALITRTNGDGGATVIVSHDGAQLQDRAGRVLILDGGRLEVRA